MRRSSQGVLSGQMRLLLLFSIAVPAICQLLSSCSASRSSYYFKEVQKDTSVNVFIDHNMDLKIRKNDVINILVSSLDRAEDLLYNTPVSLAGGAGVVSGASSYLVDEKGNIQMHKLGAVHVEGLTINQLKAELETAFLPYLREPIVAANVASRTVTLLGQIGKPQILPMTGRMSIIDAFALSGDVSPTADLKNILIIRGGDSTKEFKHINMENTRFMDSSWYYLQPNDIVYVSQDYKKLRQQEKKSNFQQNLTLAATLISLTFIVVNAVR